MPQVSGVEPWTFLNGPSLGFFLCTMGPYSIVLKLMHSHWMNSERDDLPFSFSFKKFRPDTLNVVKLHEFVSNHLNCSLRNNRREKPLSHPPSTSSPSPVSPESSSCAGSWVGVGKPQAAERAALKVVGSKGKNPESKIALFFGVYHWLLSPSNKALSSAVL